MQANMSGIDIKNDPPGDVSELGSVTSVKVAVRVRPMIGMETAAGCQPCMFGDAENNQVVAADNRCFKFDHVFGMESVQREVYETTTRPLVERCLDGFNATVLAYGQTGSGKTWTVGNAYTVNGAPEDDGIIPRAVIDIFDRVAKLREEGAKASVHASFLEVLNEEIKDLLAGGSGGAPAEGATSGGGAGLPLRENVQGEVTVAGLTQHEINGAQDLAQLLERGALCRATASTNMNAHSSRSHAICTLSFEVVRPAVDDKPETVTSSKFHLVDLAGSERAKKTGAEGRRLREGININKGLLALGNVISALSDGAGGGAGGGGDGGGGGHHVHVPYRDSKLTRLLQSSLGGNAHTMMIACISPADSNMAESLNTLRYASRAMSIKNTAVKNEDSTGPPVSYAEVLALRKEIRTLQVELVQARVSGLAGLGFGEATEVQGGKSNGAAVNEATRAVMEEAAELRRGQNALERRVLEATRQATAAVEGEMAARMESDRWRLRCEQICAILKEVAPSTASAKMPPWARGEGDGDESCAKSGKNAQGEEEPAEDGGKHGSGTVAGSLAQELRRKVFELEAQVSDLEGQLSEARRAATVGGNGGTPGGSGVTLGIHDAYDPLLEPEGEGQAHEEDPEGEDEGSGEIEMEEIRRVDREIESKERELVIKAEQARAYETMKGKFEGLLTRLQDEVSSLQTERDGLIRRLADSASGSTSTRGDGVAGGSHQDGAGGAGLSRMKARVAELEARIKEHRKKVAEHQRAERERAAAAREAERLRNELTEAKKRRADLQRVNREASVRFQKETRQMQLNEARMRRDGERMQLQMKKLEESQSKTQAALKRKMEEHSLAIRKMRKLQAQRPRGGRGSGDCLGVSGTGAGDPEMKEAKRVEMAAWLAAEIEEASAVQRAKRALKEQLRVRTEAAQKAHRLREELGQGDATRKSPADGEGGGQLERGNGTEAGDLGSNHGTELAELENRIAVGSKVIRDLQAFLASSDRNSTSTGTRLPAGTAGQARWSRLRTPWDNKTALSLLMSEAVKAKVLGMDFAESAAVKEMEARKLSREVAILRSAANGRRAETASAREAMASAVATALETVAALGGQKKGEAGETGTDESKACGGDHGKGNDKGKGGDGAQASQEGRAAKDDKTADEIEDEDEDDNGDGDEEQGYEQQERSFMVMDESDSEDDEDEDDEDDEDEDEEWLPNGNGDDQPSRKRASQSSVSSATSFTGASRGGSRKSGGDVDTSRGIESSQRSRVLNDSVSSLSSVSLGEGECSSSGGVSPSESSILSASGPGAAVDAKSSPSGGNGSGDSDDPEEAISWDNLDSYTVVQLKAFLRQRKLPVSGKKDVLITRLREGEKDSRGVPTLTPSFLGSMSPPEPKGSRESAGSCASSVIVLSESSDEKGDHEREADSDCEARHGRQEKKERQRGNDAGDASHGVLDLDLVESSKRKRPQAHSREESDRVSSSRQAPEKRERAAHSKEKVSGSEQGKPSRNNGRAVTMPGPTVPTRRPLSVESASSDLTVSSTDGHANDLSRADGDVREQGGGNDGPITFRKTSGEGFVGASSRRRKAREEQPQTGEDPLHASQSRPEKRDRVPSLKQERGVQLKRFKVSKPTTPRDRDDSSSLERSSTNRITHGAGEATETGLAKPVSGRKPLGVLSERNGSGTHNRAHVDNPSKKRRDLSNTSASSVVGSAGCSGDADKKASMDGQSGAAESSGPRSAVPERSEASRSGSARPRPQEQRTGEAPENEDEMGMGGISRMRRELEIMRFGSKQGKRSDSSKTSHTPSFLKPTKSSGAHAITRAIPQAARPAGAAAARAAGGGSHGGTNGRATAAHAQREK